MNLSQLMGSSLHEFLTIEEVERLKDISPQVGRALTLNKTTGSLEEYERVNQLDEYIRLRSLTISVVDWWVPLILPPQLTSLTITDSILLLEEILALPRTLLALSLNQSIGRSLIEDMNNPRVVMTEDKKIQLSTLLPRSLTSLKAKTISGVGLERIPLETLEAGLSVPELPRTLTQLRVGSRIDTSSLQTISLPHLTSLVMGSGYLTKEIASLLPSSLTSLVHGFEEEHEPSVLDFMDYDTWEIIMRLPLTRLHTSVLLPSEVPFVVPPLMTDLQLDTNTRIDYGESRLRSLYLSQPVKASELPRTLTAFYSDDETPWDVRSEWPPQLATLHLVGSVSTAPLPTTLTDLVVELETYSGELLRSLIRLTRLTIGVQGGAVIDSMDLPRSLRHLSIQRTGTSQVLINTLHLPPQLEELREDEIIGTPTFPPSLRVLHTLYSIPTDRLPSGLQTLSGFVDLREELPPKIRYIDSFERTRYRNEEEYYADLPRSLVSMSVLGPMEPVRGFDQSTLRPPLLIYDRNGLRVATGIDLQRSVRKYQSWRYAKNRPEEMREAPLFFFRKYFHGAGLDLILDNSLRPYEDIGLDEVAQENRRLLLQDVDLTKFILSDDELIRGAHRLYDHDPERALEYLEVSLLYLAREDAEGRGRMRLFATSILERAES